MILYGFILTAFQLILVHLMYNDLASIFNLPRLPFTIIVMICVMLSVLKALLFNKPKSKQVITVQEFIESIRFELIQCCVLTVFYLIFRVIYIL